MTISPKLSMWINIAVAILGLLAAKVLPSYVPAGAVTYVSETAGWVLAVYGAVNGALHGVSAPQPGPLASPK